MAVPSFDKFYPAIIECLKDGKEHKKDELREFCAVYLKISEEERHQTLEVSGQTLLDNRMSWGISYLKKAGLIEVPKRGIYKLTTEGLKAYKYGPHNITNAYLEQFPGYQEYKRIKKKEGAKEEASTKEPAPAPEITPDDMIRNGISLINTNLSEELLEEVLKMDPYKFENLVVQLLVKMGYGELKLSNTTQKSRDEGIDGAVTADRFGLDTIYVQAKKWEPGNNVGLHEIQQFHSALIKNGGVKGVFITTSSFSSTAIKYAQDLQGTGQKIVLVDGGMLMNLMIEYNLGVSVTKVYEIKRLDTDFFNGEN